MIEPRIQKLIRNPLFWILLFFALRLYGITNPPLEVSHNWRQATGLMVARNYYEVDNNLLYPRIDITSGKSGIIGMEFPLLNYLHYLLAELFGYEHWYGRIINLIISSIGIFFFSRFINETLNKTISLYSTIILLVSIWFAFSRKMMPDTFAISITFIGIFYGYQYLTLKKFKFLLISFLTVTLGVLSKIPAGIYFALVPFVVLSNQINMKQKILVSAFSFLSLLIVYLWYFQWNPHLEDMFGNWYNIGGTIQEGIAELAQNYNDVLKNFYFNTFQSYILFPLSIAGLLLIIKSRNSSLIINSFSVLLLFIIYMFKSGFYFHHHNYYIIPIVPVFAVFAAYALSMIKRKAIVIVLLCFGMIEAIANQSHDFRLKKSNLYKLSIKEIMENTSSKNDLIAINSGGNPQQMYLAHRKGFVFENNQINDDLYLKRLLKLDCKLIVFDKNISNNELSLPIVFEDKNYKVLRLK